MILVQIWCNTLCDDTHDIHDIHDIARNHTIKLRYHTIFTISNGTLKTPRDNFLSYIQKALLTQGFLFFVFSIIVGTGVLDGPQNSLGTTDRPGRRSLQINIRREQAPRPTGAVRLYVEPSFLHFYYFVV